MIFIPIQYQELESDQFSSANETDSHFFIRNSHHTLNPEDSILRLQTFLQDPNIETDKKAILLNNLGALYFDQGDYAKALAAH